jgi:hypothetical protein
VSASVQTGFVPVVGDLQEYMPTQPVLRPLVPKYPKIAQLARYAFVTLQASMWVSFVGCAGVVGGLLLILSAPVNR